MACRCWWGRTVKLWHAEDLTSDPFRELTGHTAPIWSIAFSSDSRLLITGSEDGSIRIWTVEIEELLDLANAVVQSDPAAFMPERRSNMLDFGIQVQVAG